MGQSSNDSMGHAKHRQASKPRGSLKSPKAKYNMRLKAERAKPKPSNIGLSWVLEMFKIQKEVKD